MVDVLSSSMEELSEGDVVQDQESNIGLVIDGEVCKRLSLFLSATDVFVL